MNKKLEDYSKEELLELVRGLRSRKKFGLVWEEKQEEVVQLCQTELPVLEEVSSLAIQAHENPHTNFIVEGDNYHSLSALNYTHAGKIDVIYADPPYNTGNTSWVYNNKIIDKNDTYRHSKWLSFMEKRLRLAKPLLKPSGVIIVTIDDYEIATLTLLMNEIFGEDNRLGTVVIKNNPSGRSTASGFSVAHEYALFYGNQPTAKIGRLKRTETQIARYKEKDDLGFFEWVNFRKHGGTRSESPKMYYPIYINYSQNSIRIPNVVWQSAEKEWKTLDEPNSGEIVVYPVDDAGKDRRWKWSIERARSEISEMKVALDRKNEPAVYIKSRMKDEGMLPLTWWDKTEYSATAYGTNLLSKIMPDGNRFDYPKSLHAVIDCLKVATTNNNALILDFFAGSGTTGHAVLELNREDGGNRQFILCTNNENKIAETITYPRIKKVIEGYGNVEGIPANTRYFRTSLVSRQKTDDQTRVELVARSTDMICLREDTFEKVIETKLFKIFGNQDHYSAILFDSDAIVLLKDALAKLDDGKPVHIYVFSLSNDSYEDDFASLNRPHELRPIPESILEVYRRIFASGVKNTEAQYA